MTTPSRYVRFGARPVLYLVGVAAVVGGILATRLDDSTVLFPDDSAIVVDSPPDSPPDVPPDTSFPADWVLQTIYGPESAIGLNGSDGVDIATIGGKLSVVSPWEQSGTISVSTLDSGTWSTITVATVVNVEDAKWCDVDGDGNLDVIAGGQGKRIKIWFGPSPFTVTNEIDAAANLELWMQLACTAPTSKTFTADNGTDTLTATAHGWSTTDLVRLSNSGGGLPSGLSTATDYYVIRTGADTFKLASSRTNAHAGTAIDFTTNGTGTQTAAGGMRVWAGGRGTTNQTFTADASTDALTKTSHSFSTGDFVRVTNSGGGLPGGLAINTTYWTIRVDANAFKLATTQANAFAGTAIDLTTAGTGTHTVTRHAILAYFQSGTPRTSSAWSHMQVALVGWVMSLIAGDFDGDGDLDVMISERQAGCCAGTRGSKWYRSDALGAWTPQAIYTPATSAEGDAKFLELVGSTVVMSGNSSDTKPNKLVRSTTSDWVSWSTTTIAYPTNVGQYQGVATCDLTGDGTDDYVLTHAASTGTLDGLVYVDGDTGVSTSIDKAAGEKYDNALCVDIDGDGDLDVLTSEQNAGLGLVYFVNPRLHP